MRAGWPTVANRLAVPLATEMRRRDTFLNFPAVANRLTIPLATPMSRGDFPLDFPAVANRLAVPLATEMRRRDTFLDFPAVANGIAVSLATAFVADSVPLVTEFIGGGVHLIKNFRAVSWIYRYVPDRESWRNGRCAYPHKATVMISLFVSSFWDIFQDSRSQKLPL